MNFLVSHFYYQDAVNDHHDEFGVEFFNDGFVLQLGESVVAHDDVKKEVNREFTDEDHIGQ